MNPPNRSRAKRPKPIKKHREGYKGRPVKKKVIPSDETESALDLFDFLKSRISTK